MLTELKARLQELVLGQEEGISRAAAHLLAIDLRERQLSSDNRIVTEGSGFGVNIIINYARPGKGRQTADEGGNDAE